MTPTRIGWLHVSDFHFRGAGDPFSQTVAVEALIRDVASRRPDRGDASFAVVTGDVAFSGRFDEYEAARPFLNRLAVAANIEPASSTLCRATMTLTARYSRSRSLAPAPSLRPRQTSDRAAWAAGRLPLSVTGKLRSGHFVDSFTTGQFRTPTVQGLGYVTTLTIDRIRLAVVGLNSAWLSGRNAEEMKLSLGERQVIEALRIVAESDPMLVLAPAHHPIEWMHEWDQGACRERLLAASDFLHRGHLHQPDLTLSGGPASPCLTGRRGVEPFDPLLRTDNWVELDLGAGRCIVQPHRYDPSLGRYEPGQSVTASIDLRGSIPGTTQGLAEAIGGARGSALRGLPCVAVARREARRPCLHRGRNRLLGPERCARGRGGPGIWCSRCLPRTTEPDPPVCDGYRPH